MHLHDRAAPFAALRSTLFRSSCGAWLCPRPGATSGLAACSIRSASSGRSNTLWRTRTEECSIYVQSEPCELIGSQCSESEADRQTRLKATERKQVREARHGLGARCVLASSQGGAESKVGAGRAARHAAALRCARSSAPRPAPDVRGARQQRLRRPCQEAEHAAAPGLSRQPRPQKPPRGRRRLLRSVRVRRRRRCLGAGDRGVTGGAGARPPPARPTSAAAERLQLQLQPLAAAGARRRCCLLRVWSVPCACSRKGACKSSDACHSHLCLCLPRGY